MLHSQQSIIDFSVSFNWASVKSVNVLYCLTITINGERNMYLFHVSTQIIVYRLFVKNKATVKNTSFAIKLYTKRYLTVVFNSSVLRFCWSNSFRGRKKFAP